jgi:lysophospholipid acyltransferase (LPLAT)-like uncharacterized protein
MKLRMPWLIKSVAFALTNVTRFWISTLNIRVRHLGAINTNPHHAPAGAGYLYAFWHENLSILPFLFGRRNVSALIGEHADAQLVAEVLGHLGMPTVRGSSTRGGVKAVLQILRQAGGNKHLALAPDGPRGPRRRVQPGLLYLASRARMPIVPIAVGFDRPWRLGSWDRLAIARPWSSVVVLFGAPIPIAPKADRGELESQRQHFETSFHALSALTETWAETGRCPIDDLRNAAFGSAEQDRQAS